MVDSDHIKKLCCLLKSLNPPVELVFLHLLPVIDGIAPKLSGFGKSIRGASCNNHRIKVGVKLIV